MLVDSVSRSFCPSSFFAAGNCGASSNNGLNDLAATDVEVVSPSFCVNDGSILVTLSRGLRSMSRSSRDVTIDSSNTPNVLPSNPTRWTLDDITADIDFERVSLRQIFS
uniref:Uncharacterized protein n=1 Tax=Anopheles atroparvus TaxID=41427 RepID=A0AAG5D3Y6_ANOAO